MAQFLHTPNICDFLRNSYRTEVLTISLKKSQKCFYKDKFTKVHPYLPSQPKNPHFTMENGVKMGSERVPKSSLLPIFSIFKGQNRPNTVETSCSQWISTEFNQIHPFITSCSQIGSFIGWKWSKWWKYRQNGLCSQLRGNTVGREKFWGHIWYGTSIRHIVNWKIYKNKKICQ